MARFAIVQSPGHTTDVAQPPFARAFASMGGVRSSSPIREPHAKKHPRRTAITRETPRILVTHATDGTFATAQMRPSATPARPDIRNHNAVMREDVPSSVEDALASMEHGVVSMEDAPASMEHGIASMDNAPVSMEDGINSMKDALDSMENGIFSIDDAPVSMDGAPCHREPPWVLDARLPPKTSRSAKAPISMARTDPISMPPADVSAMTSLGAMFYKGLGTPQDFPSAFKWFSQAAERGARDAQYQLAQMYVRGDGVPRNVVQGYVWLNVAASQGDTFAAEERDSIEKTMSRDQVAEAQRLSAAFKPKSAPKN